MEITQEVLQEKINNGEKLIVDFWAPWCGPCKVVKPLFERVSETTDVQMYTLNVEENKEIAGALGIRAIPTIKSFSDGKEVSNNVGMLQENQIKQLVNNLING
jgi:thioredoxin 2